MVCYLGADIRTYSLFSYLNKLEKNPATVVSFETLAIPSIYHE